MLIEVATLHSTSKCNTQLSASVEVAGLIQIGICNMRKRIGRVAAVPHASQALLPCVALQS